MRLKKEQIEKIIKAINNYISKNTTLYLYGSRTDDKLKGGDIDLLIITPEDEAEPLSDKKHILLAQIKKNIGDQKIDLKIADSKEIDKDPFLQRIFPTSILLHKW